MSEKPDRREFMRKASITILSAASSIILIESATAEGQKKSVAQSSEQNLERWLLETGRHTLDKGTYSSAASYL